MLGFITKCGQCFPNRRYYTNRLFSKWTLQFDGASRGNPGLGGAGAVILEKCQTTEIVTELWSGSFYLGTNVTNNQAEYSGLIEGLKQVISFQLPSILIQGDSELIIRQINSVYKVNNEILKGFHKESIDLLSKIPSYRFAHIRRELNNRADQLANEGVDRQSNLVTICQRPSIDTHP
jgi:ribonuclease HI